MTREQELQTQMVLQELASIIKAALPPTHGFFLLTFEHETETSQANYVSDSRREDVICAMKEWLIQCGHKEDWMRHIK